MVKYVSKDIICAKMMHCNFRSPDMTVSDFINDELPAADVKPVVHSKWTYGEDESGKDGIFCSNCKGFVPWDYEYYNSPDELVSDNPICSHCGARMIKDGDTNE